MIQKEVSCTNLIPFGRVFKIRKNVLRGIS